jgi:hypothetical protein
VGAICGDFIHQLPIKCAFIRCLGKGGRPLLFINLLGENVNTVNITVGGWELVVSEVWPECKN